MIAHINIRRSRLLLFLAAAVILAIFTSQGISVGDDMGYMFADKRLHDASGPRIDSLSQIISTQASHFLHFNGRFLVHSLTQLWLMEGMRPIYICLNALAGALLWLAACRLVEGRDFSARTGICMLALLWWLMPAPGVIWASLIAFSLNYLWPAVVMAWLLEALKTRLENPPGTRKCGVLLIGTAVLCGALQESFSLPLLGGVAVTWLATRRRDLLYIGIALLTGALALLAAPGNYSHAAAGGGMGLQAILHKTAAMFEATLRTPLPLLMAVAGVISVRRKNIVWLRRLSPFTLLLVSLIACSLILGCLSFTALRQLCAPSFAAVILLGRLGLRAARKFPNRVRRKAAIAAGLIFTTYIAWAIPFRADACRRWAEVETQARLGAKEISVDCSGALYNRPLLGAIYAGMNQDPFADDLLHATFDANTRRGLRRLYMPKAPKSLVPELLPAPRDVLLASIPSCYQNDTGRILTPRRLDARYSLLAIPLPARLPKILSPHGEKYPFASIKKNDTLLLILPAAAVKVKIQPGKGKQ